MTESIPIVHTLRKIPHLQNFALSKRKQTGPDPAAGPQPHATSHRDPIPWLGHHPRAASRLARTPR